MIEAQFDPRQLAELNRDLQALHPKKLVGPELDPMGRRIIKTAEVYPAPVGGIRTGHLGRSWYHRLYGLDLTIGNLAVYAGYVHGEEQTARHAQTGWKRVFDVAVDEASKLLKKLEDKAVAIWR